MRVPNSPSVLRKPETWSQWTIRVSQIRTWSSNLEHHKSTKPTSFDKIWTPCGTRSLPLTLKLAEKLWRSQSTIETTLAPTISRVALYCPLTITGTSCRTMTGLSWNRKFRRQQRNGMADFALWYSTCILRLESWQRTLTCGRSWLKMRQTS